MAELADAPDSKSGSRKRVGVRPSLWAPLVHSVAAGLAWVLLQLGGGSDCAQIRIKLRTQILQLTCPNG